MHASTLREGGVIDQQDIIVLCAYIFMCCLYMYEIWCMYVYARMHVCVFVEMFVYNA